MTKINEYHVKGRIYEEWKIFWCTNAQKTVSQQQLWCYQISVWEQNNDGMWTSKTECGSVSQLAIYVLCLQHLQNVFSMLVHYLLSDLHAPRCHVFPCLQLFLIFPFIAPNLQCSRRTTQQFSPLDLRHATSTSCLWARSWTKIGPACHVGLGVCTAPFCPPVRAVLLQPYVAQRASSMRQLL